MASNFPTNYSRDYSKANFNDESVCAGVDAEHLENHLAIQDFLTHLQLRLREGIVNPNDACSKTLMKIADTPVLWSSLSEKEMIRNQNIARDLFNRYYLLSPDETIPPNSKQSRDKTARIKVELGFNLHAAD